MDTCIESETRAASEMVPSGMKKTKILFICTGNTCRSPMCAAIYNARYAGKGAAALSRGLYADGSPITSHAAAVLKENKIPSTAFNGYEEHFSRTVTKADVETADLVVGVSSSHAMELLFRFPEYASKITCLPTDIPDPYGGDRTAYQVCFDRIDEALSRMFAKEAPFEDC